MEFSLSLFGPLLILAPIVVPIVLFVLWRDRRAEPRDYQERVRRGEEWRKRHER
jgi:hypothetical protein